MSTGHNGPPVIIKKKKIIAAEGHHGGAWKVAYADFVTAMMAFFLLMWLLNATTDKQRKGLADYFSPSIALSKSSGGGNGALGGDSLFSEETLARNGQGASAQYAMNENKARGSTGFALSQGGDSDMQMAFTVIKKVLDGNTNEETILDETKQHVASRLTEDGLVLTIQDLEGAQLFDQNNQPTIHLAPVLALLAKAIAMVDNRIAIDAYVQTRPIVLKDYDIWKSSLARADYVRDQLLMLEIDSSRFRRVTGHGDRDPAFDDRLDTRNNRINLLLLHSDDKK